MSDVDDPVRDLIVRIRRQFGLDLGGARYPILQELLMKRHGNIGIAARDLMAASVEQLVPFVQGLTNNETHFCRHRSQFSSLRRELTSAWLAGKPPSDLSVWSAGCSSGEEPITVAMLMAEIGGVVAGTGTSILATDINERALAAARLGSYRQWSFRGVPETLVQQYFEEVGDGVLRPVQSLRDRITFEYHNLMEDPPGVGTFDMVFCRNVLIYFDPDSFRVALDNLGRAVSPGGLLILGPTEGAGAELSGFDVVSDREAVLFRKRTDTVEAPSRVLFVDDDTSPTHFGTPTAMEADAMHGTEPAMPDAAELDAPVAPTAVITPPPESASEEPATVLNRVRRLADAGDRDSARSLLSTCAAEYGWSTEARLVAALLDIEEANDDAALDAVDAALEQDPDAGFAHYVRGTILERQGHLEEAEATYGRSLRSLEGLAPEAPVPLAGGLTVNELALAVDASLTRFRREVHHG